VHEPALDPLSAEAERARADAEIRAGYCGRVDQGDRAEAGAGVSLCDTCQVPGACCRSMLLVNEQGKPLLFPVVDDRTMQSYFEAAKVPLPFRPSSSQEVIDPESGEKKYSGRFRVLRWGPMADARCTISAQTYAGSLKREAS
jgi:hypothetical protein